MSQSIFKFKKFSVCQDKAAMKIGTDGVLLGAWATIQPETNSVLDIGAGTGVIALMLAQRSQAEIIDALEIDEDAHEQATNNFENSPWGDRLFCYHASLLEFADEIDESYDLIVSNPPFFNDDYKGSNSQRNLARFTDALPFSHLLDSVAKLLSENGLFSVIIPFTEEQNFIELAHQYGLFPSRITRVRGTSNSVTKRSLLEFSFSNTHTAQSSLTIEHSRHNYTEDYIKLTKNFYLNM